jgi:hypothetical protein
VPTTPTLALRYPSLSDAPNVPQNLQNLATDVETTLAGTYVAYTPTFYSNAASGTTIAGASVSVTYAQYQTVNNRCHYYGHAVINTTTASGFGVSLPFPVPFRSFSLSHITLGGASGYTTSFGRGHCPNTTGPFNRVSPVSNSNAILNIASSGDTVHWNIEYETT